MIIQPVSWADMIAVAGAEAVSVCGGPNIPVQLGRIDSMVPDPEGKLPQESLDASGLKRCFQRKGFSVSRPALSDAIWLGFGGTVLQQNVPVAPRFLEVDLLRLEVYTDMGLIWLFIRLLERLVDKVVGKSAGHYGRLKGQSQRSTRRKWFSSTIARDRDLVILQGAERECDRQAVLQQKAFVRLRAYVAKGCQEIEHLSPGNGYGCEVSPARLLVRRLVRILEILLTLSFRTDVTVSSAVHCTQELVALSGAHTLGSKGFGNPISFDNAYFKILLEKPWSSSGD
ncbi:hypothetical protein RHMOL_Rhmol07G0197800 [Rhododendron molle]|nr:hypothetical protein RHMOL_Rhmol07G0197800 [Rhododendron molle]